jgi:hypothetical protein
MDCHYPDHKSITKTGLTDKRKNNAWNHLQDYNEDPKLHITENFPYKETQTSQKSVQLHCRKKLRNISFTIYKATLIMISKAMTP